MAYESTTLPNYYCFLVALCLRTLWLKSGRCCSIVMFVVSIFGIYVTCGCVAELMRHLQTAFSLKNLMIVVQEMRSIHVTIKDAFNR